MTPEEREQRRAAEHDSLNAKTRRIAWSYEELRDQRDMLLEALVELWEWSRINGKTPAENGCRLETWGDVVVMIESAIAAVEGADHE